MSVNKFTSNNNPTLVAVSNVDGEAPVYLYANPSTHHLLVEVAGSLVAGTDYDFIDVQQTSPTVETFVYKLGGSGGTTVRTVVVTYTSSTKADIDTVEFS